MRIFTISLAFLAIAASASAYDSLAAAFSDTSSSHVHGHLTEAAVQHVIDSCDLHWQTDWDYPIGSRNRFVVWGHVSDSRELCVLTRARWSEFGLHGDATYAFVSADSGLLWTRPGTVVSSAIISDRGGVALFQEHESSAERPYEPVELVLLDKSGEVLLTESWPTHIRRPLQRGLLSEVAGFTPDGGRFIVTMNVAESEAACSSVYNNTLLCCIDLARLSVHREHLGAFEVRSLEFTDDHALLHGEWRRVLDIGLTYATGYYTITWAPWNLAKTVADTAESYPQ